VLALEPGHARIAMRDRRAVRNHLSSIHAMALANLGELTSGLAMSSALPPGVRAIVTGIDVEYSKKARGLIVAESRVTLPEVNQEVEQIVCAELRDQAGDVVAQVTARWRLRPD
jgi:acyl-coenzyme A thioesterase PaaI-like protein